MTPRERMLRSLAGERVTPLVWGDHGVSMDVVTKAFDTAFEPIQGEPPFYRLSAVWGVGRGIFWSNHEQVPL